MTDVRIAADTARYCYLDIDINHARQKLATAAAFVHATDTRYGFSSKDLRELGGSELNRIAESMANDHEWQNRLSTDQVLVKPPSYGSRIVVELDWSTAPLACENFATLCANGSSSPSPIGTSGKPLQYRNTPIHRVVPNFIVQGGDLVMGNGSGGESIFGGKKFKDERAGLLRLHNHRGLLGMGNSGKNSNTSQFYITLAASAPQCDGKHVLFGRVVSGWDVLTAMENCGQAGSEVPSVTITVTDCGIWTPLVVPGDGYWFDKPDPERYSGISPVFCVRPRVAVVAPNQGVLQKFESMLASFCYVNHVLLEDNNDDVVTTAAARISGWLGEYAVDVVLITPACKAIMETIQVHWTDDHGLQLSRDKIIIETKPVNAATVVKDQSWLTDQASWYIWQ